MPSPLTQKFLLSIRERFSAGENNSSERYVLSAPIPSDTDQEPTTKYRCYCEAHAPKVETHPSQSLFSYVVSSRRGKAPLKSCGFYEHFTLLEEILYTIISRSTLRPV